MWRGSLSLSSFLFRISCFRSAQTFWNFWFRLLMVWVFLISPAICCVSLIQWEVESVEAAVHRPLLGICTDLYHKNTNRSINLCIQRSHPCWLFVYNSRTTGNSEPLLQFVSLTIWDPFVFLSASWLGGKGITQISSHFSFFCFVLEDENFSGKKNWRWFCIVV